MKRIVLFALLISISASFASVDNDHQRATKLDCVVNAFGIKLLSVQEDEFDILEWMQLHLEYTNGTVENRVIDSGAFNKLGNEDLFIAMDGELIISLSKTNNDTFIIKEKGDGVSLSQVISCQK
jgi:hypothetical protein